MKELYEELQAYLLENFIQFSSRKTEQDRYLFSIDGKSYELFEPLQWNDDENPVFFDEAFTWVNDKTEYDRYIFKFGGCWYWFNRGEEKNINKHKYRDWETDRKSTRLNSSHSGETRMPSSA